MEETKVVSLSLKSCWQLIVERTLGSVFDMRGQGLDTNAL